MSSKKKKVRVRLGVPLPPPPRSKVLHVRLTEAEHENVGRHAERLGMVPAVFVRACLHYIMSREVKP